MSYDDLIPYIQKVENLQTIDENGHQVLNTEAELLIIGCGLSKLSEDLYLKAGLECISNLDFSQTLIDHLRDRYQGEDQTLYENMDFFNLDICDIQSAIDEETIEEDSYDLIVDKATLDCICCHQDDGRVMAAMANIHRVLTQGGTFIMVSRASPEMRMDLFGDNSLWSKVELIEHQIETQRRGHTAEKQLEKIDLQNGKYFIYVAQKL